MKLSISTAWDETSAFVASELRLLAPLALALLFLPGVVAALVTPPPKAGIVDTSPLSLLLFFVSAVLGVIGQLSVSRLALGHRERLGESIGHAVRRAPSYIGAVMLFVLPFSVLLGLLYTPMQAAVANANRGLALVLSLATLVVLVAFIIAFSRFLLNGPIAAAEGGGSVTILKRGLALTKGNVLRLLGAAVLFIIGGEVASYAVEVAIGTVVKLLLGPPELLTLPQLIIASATGAVQAVILTLFSVLFARLYAQRVAAATGVPTSGM